MRLILAGIFVFAGIMLAVVLLSGVINHASPIKFGLVMGLGMSVLIIALVIIAYVVFNTTWQRSKIEDFKSEEEQIKELEEKGQLVARDFKAIRAFEIAEGEDEGPYYFIELADRSILYLNGQYLYDYEPIDDEEHNQPRTFPCTDFTIRRHRDERYVVDILCRGNLIELESLEPDLQQEEYYWEKWEKIPDDGGIITDVSFDELRKRLG